MSSRVNDIALYQDGEPWETSGLWSGGEWSQRRGGEIELCLVMLVLKCTEKSTGVESQRHSEMNLEFRGKTGLRNEMCKFSAYK